MSEPFRRGTVLCASPTALHRLAYTDWGDPRNPRVLVCVHGLTRCARDFDPLAAALADRFRVVCPDMPGRGDSDWLKNPMEYATPTYVSAIVTLIARLGVGEVHWVGTSMGALIGMVIAALEHSPIRRMVLNEAGPLVAAAALERIGAYVGRAPDFATLDDAERYIRAISAPFGPHSDAEWRFLTEHVVRARPDGGFRIHYDPAIAVPIRAGEPHKDIDLWAFWGEVRCPTLVIRGELSDLLARETVARMRSTGPRAAAVEIAGVGHAPTLIQPTQIAIVRDFLFGD